jgi:hypothetical protein
VCDFKIWPAGRGKGPGSPRDWAELIRCYGFKSEDEALAWKKNPVDRADIFVRAGIPLVHGYGDADEVALWEENTGVMAERVKKAGGSIALFPRPGGKHHPHGPLDPASFADWIISKTLDSPRAKGI